MRRLSELEQQMIDTIGPALNAKRDAAVRRYTRRPRERRTEALDRHRVTGYVTFMSRPLKGEEPLSEPLRIKVTKKLTNDLDSIAIDRSAPGAIVTRSDVARDALTEGVKVLKRKPKK